MFNRTAAVMKGLYQWKLVGRLSPVYRFMMFLLCMLLYIPYSILVNKLMCLGEFYTCCITERVPKAMLPNNISYIRNPVEDIEFTVNSEVCDNITIEDDRVWLLVGVFSRADKFKARQVIRDTYNSVLKRSSPGPICLVFFLSKRTPSPFLHGELESEIKEHKDIVQVNKEETYRNLVYKSIALLKWADEYVRHFDFLLKIDDDVALNVPNLFHKLLLFSSQSRFIMGFIIEESKPLRNNSSRHFISKEEYSKGTLPNYMNGPSYVISGDLVSDLLGVVPRIPLVYVEDVYITALLPSYVDDVTHIGHCGFVTRKDNVHELPISVVSLHHVLQLDAISVLADIIRSSQWTALSVL